MAGLDSYQRVHVHVAAQVRIGHPEPGLLRRVRVKRALTKGERGKREARRRCGASRETVTKRRKKTRESPAQYEREHGSVDKKNNSNLDLRVIAPRHEACAGERQGQGAGDMTAASGVAHAAHHSVHPSLSVTALTGA